MEESIPAPERTRKLASIQRVTALRPHPDPVVERLQLATVLGWQVVVAKGEVDVGQLVVYCEIDSLLPVNAHWLPQAVKRRIEQMPKHKHFRVKSIKLRGQLSQGLIIPSIPTGCFETAIGTDVTDILEIKKYEPIAFSGKFAMCQTNSGVPFPSHLLKKTDEPRVQSHPHLFKVLLGQPFYATTKMDGTSGTFLIDPKTGEMLACSRNYVRQRPANLDICPYWKAAVKSNLEEKLRSHPHLALQGEICGPGIQKNPLKLKDIEFFVFNVVDIMGGGLPIPLDKFQGTCKDLGLKTVPIEIIGEHFDCASINDVLEMAKGKYVSGKTREGLVFRSWNQAISFKAINNDYLV